MSPFAPLANKWKTSPPYLNGVGLFVAFAMNYLSVDWTNGNPNPDAMSSPAPA